MIKEMNRELQVLPLLPLRGVMVFPYMMMHLDVGREKSVKSLERAMLANREILLLAQKDADIDDPKPEDLYEVGVIAEIKQLLKLPGGSVRILVEGIKRARVVRILSWDSCMEVEVIAHTDREEVSLAIEAAVRSLSEKFEQYVKLGKKVPPETALALTTIEDPSRLGDFIVSHLKLKFSDKQKVLEIPDIEERINYLNLALAKELEILELENKISSQVRKQMDKNQKEYYLREQVKAIQKELGENEERQAEAKEYRKKLKKAKLPPENLEKALKEVERLEKMQPLSAESGVVRNYLDWLLMVPWDKETEDHHDIRQAAQVLDQDHYGLKKPKERILEYLAVRQLNQGQKGPILCLTGPPGVGKTSLARSVARALGRNFVRISLGGVRDEAEIRGHRRTYIGAMPGRIIQGLRQAGTRNPVFLLDEVDKMSMDFRGDPSAALLEVLDPEQNNSFSDHYIEMPVDLSKVLFIVTANTAYNIPPALLDRMELLSIPGYTADEKLQIAALYLLPKQLKAHGLTPQQMQIGKAELRTIIDKYTREAGIRNLEREIARVCRKVARLIAEGSKSKVHVGPRLLHEFLGAPRYRHMMSDNENMLGTALGLAWTEVGGEVLRIEVLLMKGNGKLILTGKLGEVMKESAQAGYSYLRSQSDALQIPNDFHEQLDIHIHIPEGAIPKDGPSAGITMATAMASALTQKKVYGNIAMTGEITLRGKVLPVGGIKEKVLAAHRAGCQKIILPADNEKDLEEIPANICKQLDFIFVKEMSEVLKAALVFEETPVSEGDEPA